MKKSHSEAVVSLFTNSRNAHANQERLRCYEVIAMAEVSMYMTAPVLPLVASEVRVTSVLGEDARHALKTSVHHELIRRMDL